jgi:glycosyltransferase involved in cell wall biosynthesis
VSTAPHLLHVFSTFVPAGPEVRTVRLINALGPAYRHSILAIDGRTSASEGLDPGLAVRLLPTLPRAGSLATVRGLGALLREERPDLVLSYNWGAFDAVIASRLAGLSAHHLHHEDGFNADEAQRFVPRRVWARRLLLPGVARVVVPSQRLARIAAETWRLAPERVALVPNGIDLAPFAAAGRRSELRSAAGIPEDALVVGFVGHLRPVKNPLRLLRALARCSTRAHLLVLGEGEERDAALRASEELGLSDRVHLVGFQRETAPWFDAMDVFALSSDSEQMPVALLEGMASRLPVVSTDVGDVSSMLPEEQQRFVVPLAVGQPEVSLARALDTLLTDADLRATLGSANRRRVEERYTFERMLTQYRELYARHRRTDES